MTSYPPRNITAARRAVERSDKPLGPAVVISLVGETHMRWPHIFVDAARSYDYSELRHAQCVIATAPGVDTGRTIAEVYQAMQEGYFSSGFPTLVDVERQAVMHVYSISPLQVREHPPGSRTWAACFG
jgi:hypothetical protein